LGSRMTKPLFPELWNVRVEMTRSWSREGGFGVGATRTSPAVEPVASRTGTAEIEPFEVSSLRAEFPLVSKCVYLNSNATGATPPAAKAVLDNFWRTLESWRDEVWERWWKTLETHADDLAHLIGAPAGSVVCDTNMATLFARLMSSFDYRERPNIVTSDL